ncbi:MAG: hypothetical protein WCB52_16280, partial [Pseudolabrys sp.]
QLMTKADVWLSINDVDDADREMSLSSVDGVLIPFIFSSPGSRAEQLILIGLPLRRLKLSVSQFSVIATE